VCKAQPFAGASGNGYCRIKAEDNGQEGRGGAPCGHGELLCDRRLDECNTLTCVAGFGRKGWMNGETKARKERNERIN
jgi:hypothetical protein